MHLTYVQTDINEHKNMMLFYINYVHENSYHRHFHWQIAAGVFVANFIKYHDRILVIDFKPG